MSRLFLGACLCALITPSGAFAQSQHFDVRPLAEHLDEAGLEAVFSGGTFDGAYNFSDRGEARSFYRETHNANGTTRYREGDLDVPGAWAVDDDALCFTYNHPLLQGGCFRVYQVVNCFYFYSTSVPLMDNEIARDYWVARAVRDGENARCEAAIS